MYYLHHLLTCTIHRDLSRLNHGIVENKSSSFLILASVAKIENKSMSSRIKCQCQISASESTFTVKIKICILSTLSVSKATHG